MAYDITSEYDYYINNQEMNEQRTIPEGIKKYRFCELAGISRPTLNKWLKGGRVLPMTHQAIVAALDALPKEQAA